MILTINQLQRSVEDIVSRARSVEHLIHSDQFHEAWANSNETDRLIVQNIVHWLDKAKLKQWIYQHLNYETLTTPQLKLMARKQGIPYYGRMTKLQLLDALVLEEEDEEERDVKHHVRDTPENGAIDP